MLSLPDLLFGQRRAANHIDDELDDEVGEVEATVESIGVGGKVGASILGELESMMCSSETPFDVAQHGVDPSELWQVPRFFCPPTVGRCTQPALLTAAKQPSPSLRTTVPGMRLRAAHSAIAVEEKALTGESLRWIG